MGHPKAQEPLEKQLAISPGTGPAPSTLNLGASKLARWSLDILPHSLGTQSPAERHYQDTEAAIRRFVQASRFRVNEACPWIGNAFWSAAASEARRRFGSGGKAGNLIQSVCCRAEPKRRRRCALPAHSIEGQDTTSRMWGERMRSPSGRRPEPRRATVAVQRSAPTSPNSLSGIIRPSEVPVCWRFR
jgi:hypothetical protein